mmetsp:Transcript_22251/g.51331  ORF Transcript_22251/g.51331 Transcript_22251/m.51331 type:complete len:308 (+) Transcript_22251:84-1007(+)
MSSRSTGSGMALKVSLAIVVGCVSYLVWTKYELLNEIVNDLVGSNKKIIKEIDVPLTQSQQEAVKRLFEESKLIASRLQGLGDSEKLTLYGFYKQATEGDNNRKAPPIWNIVERAKHAAWMDRQGMSKHQAMVRYIEVTQLLNDGKLLGNELFSTAEGLGLKPSMPVHDEEEDHEEDDSSLEAQLRKAARQQDWDKLQELLKKGAKVDAADGNGQTALHFCADRGLKRGVELLLEANANVNAVDTDGISVLLAAVIANHVEVSRLLLDKGADPDLQDIDGDSPRSSALEESSPEMKELFESLKSISQ